MNIPLIGLVLLRWIVATAVLLAFILLVLWILGGMEFFTDRWDNDKTRALFGGTALLGAMVAFVMSMQDIWR